MIPSVESANTQHQAFKDILDLVTLLPGLRKIFLRSNFFDKAPTLETILSLWDRSGGLPDKEWAFWQTLAATALTDSTSSGILEESLMSDWFNCGGEGLSVIERLLMDCS